MNTRELPLAYSSDSRSTVILPLLFSLAVSVRLLLIFTVSPQSDVFYVNVEGVLALLNSQNPYSHIFTETPSGLLTPGSESVFAYLPFNMLYLTPFFLLGDVRFGGVVADVLTAYFSYLFSRDMTGRPSIILIGFFLFFPPSVMFTSVYGNNTMIGAAFLVASMYFFVKKRNMMAGLFFGIALASSQLVFAVVPVVLYFVVRKKVYSVLIGSLITFLVIVAPFFLLDPSAMITDVLLFPLSTKLHRIVDISGEALVHNLGLNGLTYTGLGFALPVWLKVTIMLPILVYLLRRIKSSDTFLSTLGLFSAIAIFFIPNNVFAVYYSVSLPFLVLGLFVHIWQRKGVLRATPIQPAI